MLKRILLRLLITVVSLVACTLLLGLYRSFESPVRGAANAQLLSDTAAAWGWFKFVADDGISQALALVTALWILIVWLTLIKQPKKNNKS